MDLNTFQNLPVAEVARCVRATGSKVCVFPINGTRRWFMLEHPEPTEEEYDIEYRNVSASRHLELYRLFFEHGIDTLLTPIFGPDLLERGEAYKEMVMEGLAQLATDPAFVEFYQAYQVRVRFYGDYRKCFESSPYAYLPDLLDEAAACTVAHDQYRLFFGVCAHDATETIAELAVRYFAAHGRVPDKASLIEMYYGEPLGSVDLFIGFDKFCAFDMPLVATGDEDLYFTVAPSPYLSAEQLRGILYDHMYARPGEEPEYTTLGPDARSWMRAFYRHNRGRTLGVGSRQDGIWYPLPQVEVPPDCS
jgi:hypothetical protein